MFSVHVLDVLISELHDFPGFYRCQPSLRSPLFLRRQCQSVRTDCNLSNLRQNQIYLYSPRAVTAN